MSLRPSLAGAVPGSTAMVARAAFPRGNPYMRLRDTLGTMFTDQQFAALFPSHGQPAQAPWRLALVTQLQFAENLSDRRAADAARGRIDWKYLLGLELADPGFDASVLSEFRTRLITGGEEALLLDMLLALCREQKLLVPRGRSCPRFRLRSRWNGNGGGSARTARMCLGPSAPSTGWAAPSRRCGRR